MSACTTNSQRWRQLTKDEVKNAEDVRDNAIIDNVTKELLQHPNETNFLEEQMLPKEDIEVDSSPQGREYNQKPRDMIKNLLSRMNKKQEQDDHQVPIKSYQEGILSKVEDRLLDQDFNKDFMINIMDFGGQPIYHNIQKIYLVSNAVYCNVFNLSDNLDAPAEIIDPTTKEKYKHRLTNLEVILYSIRSVYTNSKEKDQIDKDQQCPPIILIGTHLHSLGETEEERNRKMKAQFDKINNALMDKPYKGLVHSVYFAIENSQPSSETVKQVLDQIWKFLKKMVYTVPVKWLSVQAEIQRLKNTEITLTINEMMTIAERFKVIDSARELLLGYMHDIGEFLYFPKDDELKNVVVLNPSTLVDISRTFITVLEPDLPISLKRSWKKLDHGILEGSLLVHLLAKFNIHKGDTFDTYVALLQKFGLICEKKSEGAEASERIFYVLSRLSPHFMKKVLPESYSDHVSIYYDFCGYLPDDMFQRSATKFIEKFEKSGTPAPTLAYEFVGLHVADNHYVSLSVVTVKYRRLIEIKIMKTTIPGNTINYEEEVDSMICQDVKKFLDSILGMPIQSGGRPVNVRVCIPCNSNSSSKDTHFHFVENFSKDLCGSMGEQVDQFCRLFGGKRGVLEVEMIWDICNEMDDGWKRLGLKLQIPWEKITSIEKEYKHPEEATMEMITTWQKQLPSDANQVQLMIEALEAKGDHNIAKRLKRDKHYQEFSGFYLDDLVLLTISEGIKHNWKVFVSLGMWGEYRKNKHQDIDMKNMDILTIWRSQKNGRINQLDVMCKALRDNKLKALAKKLENLVTEKTLWRTEGSGEEEESEDNSVSSSSQQESNEDSRDEEETEYEFVSSSSQQESNEGLSEDDFNQLLVTIGTWYNNHRYLNMLKVLLKDIINNNELLSKAENVMELFRCLISSGKLSPTKLTILCEITKVTGKTDFMSAVRNQLPSLPKTMKSRVSCFTQYRLDLVKLGKTLTQKDIETLDARFNLFSGLKQYEDCWCLITDLEDRGKLCEGKMDSFLDVLQENGITTCNDVLEDRPSTSKRARVTKK